MQETVRPRQLAAGSWKMRTKKTSCLLAILVVPWLGRSPGRVAASEKVESAINVAPAWSAIPVGFCLLRNGNHQYAAYYDPNRRLIVAGRTLDSAKWDSVA